MSKDTKHPADEIAQALARANGILTVISGCYDRQAGEFAIGTAYLAESIAAVDSLLNAATQSLAKLYQTCDLSVIREIPVADPVTEEPQNPVTPEPVIQTEATPATFFSRVTEANPTKTSYLATFGPSEPVAPVVERQEAPIPVFKPAKATKRESLLEQPATTYDELLAKVTAVADQAAYQAPNSPADRALLPALEGLRADLLKMRAVA